MPIKTSGPLSTTDIVNEFNTTNEWATKPNIMSQFYGASPDIPNVGSPISFSDFYGASNVVYVSGDEFKSQSDALINGLYNIENCNLWTVLQGLGHDDDTRRYDVIIPQNMWLWSSSTQIAGLTIPNNMSDKIVIRNFGNIIGQGGNGGTEDGLTNGQDGGPAVRVQNLTAIDLLNQSGAYIAAGGGGGGRGNGSGGAGSGGGGGAGGGIGGDGFRAQGGRPAGGSLNRAGANAKDDEDAGGGRGGGAGGGSGAYDDGKKILGIGYDQADGGSGGGGGRILPGVGGAGGTTSRDTQGVSGGSSNLAGANGGFGAGGGGGGWGASGGTGNNSRIAGGAGGKAISVGSSRLVNIRNENGTIWGRE